MNKKEAENKTIDIYWWNMGHKTLDFRGTYKDYLKKRDIKVSQIKHPFAKDMKGYRFRIPLSSTVARVDCFDSDYIESCDKAILIFLTLMGDKALFHNGYGRTYNVNYR